MKKYLTTGVATALASLLPLFAPPLVARADIFQWEYIYPTNPELAGRLRHAG